MSFPLLCFRFDGNDLLALPLARIGDAAGVLRRRLDIQAGAYSIVAFRPARAPREHPAA